jgi:hypothetical protein
MSTVLGAMDVSTPEAAAAAAKKREFPYADVVKENERRRQLRLLQAIKGRCAVEIVRVVETRSGEDVFVTFFGKGKTAIGDEKMVAWIWLVEQKRHFVRFEEVVHRNGAYLLDGRDLTKLIMDGDYAY